MKVLGIRYCSVSPDARSMAGFLDALGLPRRPMEDCPPPGPEDAFAANAKANGLSPEGPMDAHGERIYFLKAPDGTQVSFQSRLAVGQAAP